MLWKIAGKVVARDTICCRVSAVPKAEAIAAAPTSMTKATNADAMRTARRESRAVLARTLDGPVSGRCPGA
jgi:hypothetical protein